MIDTSIHKLMIVFSTKYFTQKIFKNPDKVSSLCRGFIKTIISDEDDYYLYADFSSKSILSIEGSFLNDIDQYLDEDDKNMINLCYKSLQMKHKKSLSKKEIDNIIWYIETLSEKVYLYYLEFNEEKTTTIENIINHKYLDVSEDSWLNSEDKFDLYILKIMGEMPDVVFDFYMDMIHPPIYKLYPFLKDNNLLHSIDFTENTPDKKTLFLISHILNINAK